MRSGGYGRCRASRQVRSVSDAAAMISGTLVADADRPRPPSHPVCFFAALAHS
jgi:hypothetical protein